MLVEVMRRSFYRVDTLFFSDKGVVSSYTIGPSASMDDNAALEGQFDTVQKLSAQAGPLHVTHRAQTWHRERVHF